MNTTQVRLSGFAGGHGARMKPTASKPGFQRSFLTPWCDRQSSRGPGISCRPSPSRSLYSLTVRPVSDRDGPLSGEYPFRRPPLTVERVVTRPAVELYIVEVNVDRSKVRAWDC